MWIVDKFQVDKIKQFDYNIISKLNQENKCPVSCDCSATGKSSIKEGRRKEKETPDALAPAIAQSDGRSDSAAHHMCGPQVPG